jgi:hypothetical protein
MVTVRSSDFEIMLKIYLDPALQLGVTIHFRRRKNEMQTDDDTMQRKKLFIELIVYTSSIYTPIQTQ